MLGPPTDRQPDDDETQNFFGMGDGNIARHGSAMGRVGVVELCFGIRGNDKSASV